MEDPSSAVEGRDVNSNYGGPSSVRLVSVGGRDVKSNYEDPSSAIGTRDVITNKEDQSSVRLVSVGTRDVNPNQEGSSPARLVSVGARGSSRGTALSFPQPKIECVQPQIAAVSVIEFVRGRSETKSFLVTYETSPPLLFLVARRKPLALLIIIATGKDTLTMIIITSTKQNPPPLLFSFYSVSLSQLALLQIDGNMDRRMIRVVQFPLKWTLRHTCWPVAMA